MSNPDTSATTGLLIASIGHCIMQWAAVELQVALLFHAFFGPDREAADRLFSRVRSFEAKLQIVHDLASLRLKNPGAATGLGSAQGVHVFPL